MSKYLMNKIIHHINMTEAAEKEYSSHPRAFVEKWEEGQRLKFTAEEREALAVLGEVLRQVVQRQVEGLGKRGESHLD